MYFLIVSHTKKSDSVVSEGQATSLFFTAVLSVPLRSPIPSSCHRLVQLSSFPPPLALLGLFVFSLSHLSYQSCGPQLIIITQPAPVTPGENVFPSFCFSLHLLSYTLLPLFPFIPGHVDAGKSTLMGHLLYLLGNVNKRTMHKYEQESKKAGKASFAYAWVLDETGEERDRYAHRAHWRGSSLSLQQCEMLHLTAASCSECHSGWKMCLPAGSSKQRLQQAPKLPSDSWENGSSLRVLDRVL